MALPALGNIAPGVLDLEIIPSLGDKWFGDYEMYERQEVERWSNHGGKRAAMGTTLLVFKTIFWLNRPLTEVHHTTEKLAGALSTFSVG